MLARLRFTPEMSRGRRYPEPDHPYRNPYQRDRDRVVHARAFRRLKHKTQVFTAPLSDHFRDRLTHSIEVSQIGRTVARALGLNEDLVEALALAHDLGHPPFGHSGEQALDEEMQRFGESFDHNRHALRVVERFEQRYAAFPGLNLTFEVREGLLKHSRELPEDAAGDLAEFLPGQRPPLEAQLIDPVDEIAYNCADLDDAVEAKLVNLEDLRRQTEVFGEALAAAERTYPEARRWLRFNEGLRALTHYLVTSLIDGARVASEEAGVATVEDVRLAPARLARLTPEAASVSRSLKGFLHERVYASAALDRGALRASEKVRALFRFYCDHPAETPKNYQVQAESEPLHRVVCDYIAGMTDKFLLRRYEAVFGAEQERQ